MPRTQSVEARKKLNETYNFKPVLESDLHIPRKRSVKTPYGF